MADPTTQFADLLEKVFPRLAATGWQKSSDADTTYNCIAHAAGHQDAWWQPGPLTGGQRYFWPDGVPEDSRFRSYVQVFQQLGYSPCTDGALEAGFEKVVIFADDLGQGTHAARQLPNGRWTSKLGKHIDIEHAIDGLDGAPYGKPVQFLKRPKSLP